VSKAAVRNRWGASVFASEKKEEGKVEEL